MIGSGYWPLPWYLRSFGQVGYWQEPGKIADKLDRFPLVMAMPETADGLLETLSESHSPVPHELRTDVVVTVFVRNDVLIRWMEK